MSFAPLSEHVLKIASGATPLGGQASYHDQGIPFVRSQNVLMGSFSRVGLAHISGECDERMATSRVLPNEVLLNITGASIGRVCVVPDEICPANVNQHVAAIRCKESIDPHYLALYLASPQAQARIMTMQSGGTRQALTKEMIETFEIPVISIEEQRRLALQIEDQLSAIQQAKMAAHLELEEWSKFADAVISQSCRHPGAHRTRLGEGLEEITRGIGSDWSRHLVLGATREGLAPAKEPVGKYPERYKLVTLGTIFYNPMRIMIGSIAMVDEGDSEGITSPDYVVLRGRAGKIDSRWFYYWLRSKHGKHCIESLARGAVRERMLFSRLAEGVIALPPLEEQLRVARTLQTLRQIRITSEHRLKELARLPAKLLATAFSQ